MLNAMRNGASSAFVKFFMFGLLMLAMGGLALSGGYRFNGLHRNTVAKINGDELSLQEYDSIVRRTLARQGMDVQTAYKLGFLNQILQNELSNNIVHRAATDMGLQVSDPLVLQQINKLIEPLVTPQMDKKSALAAVIRNQGLTERDFVRMIKAEMSNTLLRNAVMLGTQAPIGPEAKDVYQFNNEERTVRMIYLPHSGITKVAEPADETLMAFYQAGQERYAIPETRTFTVGTLSQKDLEKTLDISDEELQATYEKDKDSYTAPEKRTLEQAVLDDETAAAAIAAAAKEGKSLKEAVKSQTGSEEAYLGEQDFEKGSLPDPLGEESFKADKGAVVGPLKTALGWHVLKVGKITEPKIKSFEEVKPGLKKDLIQMRLADQMYEMGNQLDDTLAGGTSLEDAAAEMGLETKQYGPVKADGSTAENKDGVKDFGPDWPVIAKTVFETGEGETAPVMELADGRYAAIRVDKINEKTYKPFEEVKPDLAKVWIQDQKEVANKIRAQDAFEQLDAGAKTLDQVAADLGAKIQTVKLVRMNDAVEPLTNADKSVFYGLEKNKPGWAPAKDGFVLGEVTAIKLPDVSKLKDDDLKQSIEIAQKSEQNEMVQLYYNHLQSSYNVKINQRLIDSTYGPGSEQN